jgi:hypothetical protein
MKRFTFFGVVLAIAVIAAPASAADIFPSGVVSSKPDGADFDYTITLTNSSSSKASIGTFWFAWIPGEDFMGAPPLSVTSPTGWKDRVTNGGPGDGFAIQFVSNSSSDNVAIGGSLTFQFESALTPAQIAGDSPFYPGTPVETAFVYPVGPFSDAGHQFVVSSVSSVPEPSTLTLGILALAWSYAYSRFKRKRVA